jgi:hypothetical protein
MDSGGFSSTRSDPVYHYHSVFDSERWQEVYGDPGFVKHVGLTSQGSELALTSFQVAIAKNLGLQTLRLSSALVLPFNTTHYALELENYLNRSAKPSQAYSFSDICTLVGLKGWSRRRRQPSILYLFVLLSSLYSLLA